MKKLLTIILASAFFAACGAGGGNSGGSIIPSLSSDKFTVKLKGADAPFEIKKAVATVRPDLKELQLLLANYEIDMQGKTIMGAPDTFAAGQKYIKFFIKNQKATSAEYKTPIKPGEYTEDIVTSYYDHDEPGLYETFFAKQGGTRKVTITSITEEKVTGTIDVIVGDNSIKGKFEAQFLPK